MNNFDKVAPRFLEYYSEIVLLILDSSKIDDVIKKHYSKKLDSYYPHLYGPIKKEYVVKVIPLVFDQVNKWQLPDLGDLK